MGKSSRPIDLVPWRGLRIEYMSILYRASGINLFEPAIGGVVVAEVEEGSPAAAAGSLAAGQLITFQGRGDTGRDLPREFAEAVARQEGAVTLRDRPGTGHDQMKIDELRQAFLEFFKSRGLAVPPERRWLVPNDLTVLFTPAGMNQFKTRVPWSGRPQLHSGGHLSEVASAPATSQHRSARGVSRNLLKSRWENFSFGETISSWRSHPLGLGVLAENP